VVVQVDALLPVDMVGAEVVGHMVAEVAQVILTTDLAAVAVQAESVSYGRDVQEVSQAPV
jgi:hypothetical protein